MKVGIYIHDGFTFEPRAECPYYWGFAEYEPFLDWLRYAGVERVEYCQQMGWYRYPTLPEELDRLRARQRLVEAAHRRGMEFSLILGTNLYSRWPPERVPPGQLEISEDEVTECPQKPGGFARTSGIGLYYARCFRGADAFEVFAGDWGGCRCGHCGIEQYLEYVRFYAECLEAEQPQARIWANLWSISSWQKPAYPIPTSLTDPNWRYFWDDEIAFSQRFLAMLDRVPPHVGLAFPLHHWYRGFCQRWYREEELPFWPDYGLLKRLAQSGRPLLAWTHFIVENDPYHGRLWGTLSVRLRYLRQLAGLLAQAPFEGVMGNVYSARQALNLYALVRFCREPETGVEQVIADFAAEVARSEGRALLEDALVYLENRDPWEEDLPPYKRLPPISEKGIRFERLAAAIPELALYLRRDTPLLLNGAEAFARTVAEAWALAQEKTFCSP